MIELEEVLKMLPVVLRLANENLDAINRVRDLKPCYTVEHASSDRDNVPIRGRGGWDLVCMDCLTKALDGEQS